MTHTTKNEEVAKTFISKTYHRFEAVITTGVVILTSIMIIAGFWGLIIETYNLIHHDAFENLEHKAFQSAFGMIMTILIALEFNRTIMHAYVENRREVMVKTVVLVSILAISRHFIVLEIETISPYTLAALALSVLSLGIVYWLMGRTPSSNEDS